MPGPIRVLHVEDEKGARDVTRLFLEKKGHNVYKITQALSAEQGLEKVENAEFDVIVSDYKMSGMDGLEFLKELRNRGNDTPFILFTGKGEEKVAIEALNKGANRYIKKQGRPDVLFDTLGRYIQEVLVERREAQEDYRVASPPLKGREVKGGKEIKSFESLPPESDFKLSAELDKDTYMPGEELMCSVKLLVPEDISGRMEERPKVIFQLFLDDELLETRERRVLVSGRDHVEEFRIILDTTGSALIVVSTLGHTVKLPFKIKDDFSDVGTLSTDLENMLKEEGLEHLIVQKQRGEKRKR
ncbi:MAG: response regulator [Halobacteriota archaeon]